MEYILTDLGIQFGLWLWILPVLWLYAVGFRYILKLAKENEELREINDVLRVKIASYELHKPVEQQSEPEWVRYLYNGTDPHAKAVQP